MANKFKWSAAGRTLKLTKSQTRVYENSGPAGDSFRREVKVAAKERAVDLGKTVEIHSFDGITFEHFDGREG